MILGERGSVMFCMWLLAFVIKLSHSPLFCADSGRNQGTFISQSNLTTGSVSPVKRIASGNGLSVSRHHKKKTPLYTLNIAAPGKLLSCNSWLHKWN